jgi:predicted dehydrogenase
MWAGEIMAQSTNIQLITLDPGHFHAALVQKTMYPAVHPQVKIYAPAGPDLQQHLGRINNYNKRPENPTNWQSETYTAPDFFEKMLADKAGNVVVMSGNNRIKADYISKTVAGGFNVLADKPMIINHADFEKLKESFERAQKNKVLLYDIMTERYEITTMLQRELSRLPAVFGKLQKGSPQKPAVTKESVHHFYKYVSGSVLTRPAWFLDVAQQGEGIVDVNTHLVDLIQWECFPEQVIDYKKDIKITSARRWPTVIGQVQFKDITKQDGFPEYLKKDLTASNELKVYANGEINYQIKGVNARASVTWAYKAPDGAGDTHYSIMRGTKANLIIRQGAEQAYKPSLYIEPLAQAKGFEAILATAVSKLAQTYPQIALKKAANGYEISIPESLRESHEAHFARVMQKYLDYLQQGKMPAWEVPNMLAKYYTTTQALQRALAQ